MPSLGETTARLAAQKKAWGQDPGRTSVDTSMAEMRGFGFNPGALAMMAYVPPGLPPRAPLVVVLHGCTQRAAAYAQGAGWLSLSDRLGFAVLAPEQDRRNNVNGCFNWFEPSDTRRDEGETASIHAMVQHMVRTHDLDPERVFITGLSAGGAMAAVLMATYPETFAAGAVIAGLPFGVADSVQEAFSAMHTPTRLAGQELGERVLAAAPAAKRRPRLAVWHGLADSTVASGNALALTRQWASIQNLPEQPAEVLSQKGWTRSIWRGADGETVIESNLIGGLGHGTPLAAGGDDPIGQVGPFLLEAGIASSLEIARFWGLAPVEAWPQEAVGAARPLAAETGAAGGVGDAVIAAVSPHVSPQVQDVIAAALSAAGLLR